ncbi:hypothetical protein PILCRDRAFT_811495 [Piloderma croceum F 1598]|uniref:Uncharacterized protein n=1 Tax=Piloderma croceum (strain F 1598) TaxID=765440 RepID=A0A0C3BWS0_PILCF|nr:hypothetical protein PILCRDRAFT_811495 [Piloderma croceum F 1598]
MDSPKGDTISAQALGSPAAEAPALGIDMEVARFVAEHKSNVTKPIELDEATKKRLRWMAHKCVLVVMVVTYFGQMMDKLSDVPSCFSYTC